MIYDHKIVFDEVVRYMTMLGASDLPKPSVRLADNLGSRWLGRCVWSPKAPLTTVVQIQRIVCHDLRSLQKVVAHETIHHINFLTKTDQELRTARFTHRWDGGHDARWHAMADRVNAVEGKGFVTVTSDESTVTSSTGKKFLMLIEPMHGPGERFMWAWGVRISPEAQPWVQRHMVEKRAKLVESTEIRFTQGVAKIKRWGGMTICNEPEIQTELARLYREGRQNVDAAGF
jgi:hypothetical protein